MKTLAASFRRNGFDFKQVVRNQRFAIYQKSKPGAEPGAILTGWEVIEIQRVPEDRALPNGDISRKGDEFYPHGELWGPKAWTFRSVTAAWAKFKTLTALHNAKITAVREDSSDFDASDGQQSRGKRLRRA